MSYRYRRSDHIENHPVKANTVIAKNSLVCIGADGYAVPAADTAGLKFAGVAKAGADNTGGADGAIYVQVRRRGRFLFNATSITLAMVGQMMYAAGATTFDETTTNNIPVGILTNFISVVQGWIDVGAAVGGGMLGDKIQTGEIADLAVTEGKIGALAVTEGKIGALAVTEGKIGALAVSTGKIAANAVSLAKVAAGLGVVLAADDAKTTSREENVAGLASAIALANALKVTMNAHGADAVEHPVAADTVNFPVATDNASDLPTLLTLAGALLTAYDGHDDDAELGEGWAYHEAQETGDHSLASAVAPVTLQEAITRLNDLKAKYNAHDADAQCHLVGGAHQEATADAAYGAAILVTITGALVGDLVFWSILNGGTGTVTGVSAVAGAGNVTFTFSADPQNDAIISYMVARLAV